MTSDHLIRGILRATAIAIAVLALIDPTVTSKRKTKPVVAIVAGDAPGDAALLERVDATLARSFVTVRGPAAAVDATVLAGQTIPDAETSGPAFAVSDERSPAVMLEDVRAPAWTPVDARAQVLVRARVAGARGKRVDVVLRRDGLTIARESRTIASNSEHIAVPLSFVPTSAGGAHLTASAAIEGGLSTAAADLLVDVRARKWAVLFFDPRPSWMSTFVRRAIEQDSRFVITSRVVTSRDLSTDAGTPPAHLNDLAALGAFDAVVVGAPEALNASDVSGLEAFLRRRGGSVVFLFDRQAKGAYEQLTRVARWSADSSGKAASITATGIDTATLRAAEMAWPTRLAGGAEPVALANANRPVVWRASVGAGQIVVSGAFDSWRFRDASVSGFDHFWRSIIAEAANSAPPPVDVRVENAVLAPGRATNVTVTLRDIALASGNMQSLHASVSAKLESDSQNTSSLIRLWPDRTPGEFRGRLRADAPGAYRLVVASGGSRVETPIVVSPRAAHPAPSNEDVLTAWTAAHGGHVIPASQLARLPAALNDALQVPTRLETWHPMRSAWWLVPFVLALSAEWWMRRRRGLN